MDNKLDIIKGIIFAVIKTVLLYVWWAVVLFILSLMLLNVWKVEWTEILIYAGWLTVITAAGSVLIKHLSKKKADF